MPRALGVLEKAEDLPRKNQQHVASRTVQKIRRTILSRPPVFDTVVWLLLDDERHQHAFVLVGGLSGLRLHIEAHISLPFFPICCYVLANNVLTRRCRRRYLELDQAFIGTIGTRYRFPVKHG